MTVAVRPDLTHRTAISKSELGTAGMCQRRAWYQRTDPRPWVPIEKVTFGSAVDAGVEALVSQLRAYGKVTEPDVALEAAFQSVERDGIAVDFDGVTNALERFPLDVAPQFDWAFAATQHAIHLEIEGIGEVDGHPDLIFHDDAVYDVKTAGRAKTPEDIRYGTELPFYALLREAETGTAPPRVGYLAWLRLKKPYWQVIAEPVTPEMLTRARLYAEQYAYAVRLNEKAGANVALIGMPRSWSLCADCQWNDTCPLAVLSKEVPDAQAH